GAGTDGRSSAAIGAMASGAGAAATAWWIRAESSVATGAGASASAGASGAGTASRSNTGAGAAWPPSCGTVDAAVGVAASIGTPRSLAAQRGQCSGGRSVAGSVATRALQKGQLMNMAGSIQARAD